MHTKGPKEDPLVDMGYEIRDVDYPMLRKATIYFFVFAFAMFFIGWYIFKWMNPVFAPGFQANTIGKIPGKPIPLLQDNETNVTDIMALRQAETARLTSTGWADDAHTKVHIPIEKAIDLLVKEGLPVVGANTPAVSKGNTTGERKTTTPEMAPPVSEGGSKPAVKTPATKTPVAAPTTAKKP
jgi:hypothetical protein